MKSCPAFIGSAGRFTVSCHDRSIIAETLLPPIGWNVTVSVLPAFGLTSVSNPCGTLAVAFTRTVKIPVGTSSMPASPVSSFRSLSCTPVHVLPPSALYSIYWVTPFNCASALPRIVSSFATRTSGASGRAAILQTAQSLSSRSSLYALRLIWKLSVPNQSSAIRIQPLPSAVNVSPRTSYSAFAARPVSFSFI